MSKVKPQNTRRAKSAMDNWLLDRIREGKLIIGCSDKVHKALYKRTKRGFLRDNVKRRFYARWVLRFLDDRTVLTYPVGTDNDKVAYWLTWLFSRCSYCGSLGYRKPFEPYVCEMCHRRGTDIPI